VVVNDDQLSLAIGKRGQNVRLAARLTNWDVDILTPQEFTKGLDVMEETLKAIEGVEEEQVDRLAALGVISVFDVEEIGPEYLGETLGVDEAKALEVIGVASERGKTVAEEQAIEKEENEARKKAEFKAQQAAMSGGGAIDDLLGGAAADSPSKPSTDNLADGEGSIVDLLEARQEDEAPAAEDTPAADAEEANAEKAVTEEAAADPVAADEADPATA